MEFRCNSVFIDFGGISLIVTNGFILDKNNISDLYLLPMPATNVAANLPSK